MRNKYTHQQLEQEEHEEEEEQHYRQQRSNKFLPMLCSLSTKQVIRLSVSHQRSSSACSSTTSSTVSNDDPLSPKVGCMGQVKRNNKVVGFPPKNNNFTTSTCSNNMLSMKCHEKIISTYSTNNNNGVIVKYHMLKRLFFSSKSLTTSPTTTAANATANATAVAVAVARSRAHKGGNDRYNHRHRNNNNRGIKGSCDVVVTRDHDDHGRITRCKIDENCDNGDVSGKKRMNKNGDEKGSFVNLMDLDPPLPVVKQKQQEEENMSLWKRRSKGAPLKSLQVQVVQQSCNLPLQATTV